MSEFGDTEDPWGGAEFAFAADRLDTPQVVEAADSGDMLRQVASSAAQVRTAVRSCQETDLTALSADARPRAVVVAGMGGSGIAGQILAAICGERSPVQVVSTSTSGLPGWVGAADLVIAVSSSGTTAETLAVATEAARRGCPLVGVGAEGSGLHRIAEQARAPFVPVVAAGLARSKLWSVTIPLLIIAERLGMTRVGAQVYELAASRLEEVSHQCRPASESFVNPGKSLALDLIGSLPMIWATSALGAAAASRFASQILQNAKYPALTGVLPEALHGQIATFDGPFASDEGKWPLRLILITDPDADSRIASRREAVTDVVSQRGIGMSELDMDGEHPLIRLASVIQLTDYASVYLGIASGIDPAQVGAIMDLQARIE